MIESGNGWKFRDHLADKVIFEEQVVEHLVTGHLAVRRVFPERLNKDAVAMEAIRRQVEISTEVEHHGMQRLFATEVINGSYCVYGEYIDGQSLELLAARKNFRVPHKWAAMAIQIVELFSELQAIGVAFDRINLGDMRLTSGVLQVANRFPVGILKNDQLNSAYLSRVVETNCGGLYVADGRFPFRECMARLKELLFHLGSGQVLRSVDDSINHFRDLSRSSGVQQYSLLGLEQEIESIIMRLHDTTSGETIGDLDTLLAELKLIMQSKKVKKDESTDAKKLEAEVAEHIPVPRPLKLGEEKPAPDPSTPSRRDPPTGSRRLPVLNASDGTRIQMAGQTADEDLEEDRSYLYPSKQAEASKSEEKKKSSSSSTLIETPMNALAGKKRSKGKNWSATIKWSVVVLVVLGAAYGGWVAYQNFSGTGNQLPTAVIAPLPGPIAMSEKIVLDGSRSSDPENAALRYNWSLPDLGSQDFVLRPNNGEDAAAPELQIFTTGTFTIELRVFDGQNYSPTVSTTVQVSSN